MEVLTLGNPEFSITQGIILGMDRIFLDYRVKFHYNIRSYGYFI